MCTKIMFVVFTNGNGSISFLHEETIDHVKYFIRGAEVSRCSGDMAHLMRQQCLSKRSFSITWTVAKTEVQVEILLSTLQQRREE